MPLEKTVLGTMKPVGGGDPVPLLKTEMIIGRRPSCDIQLDFENVSGKHCQLRFVNKVWHVRDLGSSNGTRLNGASVASEHAVMPDDELSIATHVYTIDYEPGGPPSHGRQDGHGGKAPIEEPLRKSLLELAGLSREDDDDRPRPKKTKRPEKAPEAVERLSADQYEFEDSLPSDVKFEADTVIDTSDDDFFKLFEDDVPKKSDKDKK